MDSCLGSPESSNFSCAPSWTPWKSLSLQRQLSTAHLRALQMQLEPHFLFNTLNAITTLVELRQAERSSGDAAHLNAILKSTLTGTLRKKFRYRRSWS